ncbi:Na+ symporter family protein [Alcanivorax sp. S71-1-4]|uniref:bile acid:sodium symporter family protein n=1 Tax=Alcanivorax sp. S71-1-4 TaxID=1177159 RepID=UPI001358722B|nr:bile acid:sodium symporter family protein [Alcanivorax sp. S71-1-4]KAF0805843.1 Na+ symporter family protein [Alcanivorax sp. S71-1-4]
MLTSLTRLFPLWALLAALLAWAVPAPLDRFGGAITPLLMLIMFSMGLTLNWQDFARVWQRPGRVALGVLLQFSIMPLAALAVARLLQLSPELTTGLVLVGCCPGGTASNLICYLARANVALSVTLTAVSTLLAVLLTPALVMLYLGTHVPVPAAQMLWSLVQIVLLPVLGGVLINSLAGKRLSTLQPWLPLLSMLAIVVVIAVIVAINQGRIATVGLTVLCAVVLHNLLGMAAGYGVARLARTGEADARTLAIEVGMQNSGLGVALAMHYFTPLAALPGALFSVWHNLSGALLASVWGRR